MGFGDSWGEMGILALYPMWPEYHLYYVFYEFGILLHLKLGFYPTWNWDFGIWPYLKLGFWDSSTPSYTPLSVYADVRPKGKIWNLIASCKSACKVLDFPKRKNSKTICFSLGSLYSASPVKRVSLPYKSIKEYCPTFSSLGYVWFPTLIIWKVFLQLKDSFKWWKSYTYFKVNIFIHLGNSQSSKHGG